MHNDQCVQREVKTEREKVVIKQKKVQEVALGQIRNLNLAQFQTQVEPNLRSS